MSKIRNRRYYSGYNKSRWLSAKRTRLYYERGGICECCKKAMPLHLLQLHHIVPKSKLGRDIDSNVELLCKACHRKFHDD